MLRQILLTAPLLLAQDATAPDFALTFAWGERGEVRVFDSTLKQGKESETTFVLRWEPIEGTDDLLVEMADMAFVSYGGVPADDPSLAMAMGMLEPMLQVVPSFRITRAGDLVEVGDVGEALEAVLALYESEEGGEQKTAMLRQAFGSPQAQALVTNSIVENWTAWVGFWAGFEGEYDENYVVENDAVALAPQFDIAVGGSVEHRGMEALEASMTAVADPERLMLRMVGFFDAITDEEDEALRQARKRIASSFESAERVDSFGGLYALDGLRPLEVTTEMRVRVTVVDGEPQQQIERHRYRFEWPGLEPLEGEGDEPR